MVKLNLFIYKSKYYFSTAGQLDAQTSGVHAKYTFQKVCIYLTNNAQFNSNCLTPLVSSNKYMTKHDGTFPFMLGTLRSILIATYVQFCQILQSAQIRASEVAYSICIILQYKLCRFLYLSHERPQYKQNFRMLQICWSVCQIQTSDSSLDISMEFDFAALYRLE